MESHNPRRSRSRPLSLEPLEGRGAPSGLIEIEPGHDPPDDIRKLGMELFYSEPYAAMQPSLTGPNGSPLAPATADPLLIGSIGMIGALHVLPFPGLGPLPPGARNGEAAQPKCAVGVLGLPLDQQFTDPSGRPVAMIAGSKPIAELM